MISIGAVVLGFISLMGLFTFGSGPEVNVKFVLVEEDEIVGSVAGIQTVVDEKIRRYKLVEDK